MALIISIISILISIASIILSIKSLIINNIGSSDTQDNKINIEKILYSLEFNTKIDGKIRPLLGKYENEAIAKEVTISLYKENPDIINQDNIKQVEDHIRDVLLNYNNTYSEAPIEKFIEPIDESYYKYKPIPSFNDNSQKSKTADITHSLNNFYKD